MSLQFAALHRLLALRLERTADNQLIQQVSYQEAGLVALLEREFFPIHGTKVVLLHEVFEALETVRVAAGGVHGLQQGLKADVANEFVVHLVLEVVEVIVRQEVELAALTAELASLVPLLFCCGVSHDSQDAALSGQQEGNLSRSSRLTEFL